MTRFERRMKDAGVRFQTWRRSNPEVFVLNEGARWVVHLAKCCHFEPRCVSPLGSPKSCSVTFAPLEDRAR
jgi:hypothetical protein